MRVLVITNIFPTQLRPFVSPFVKEQVESLRECYPDLTIDVRVVEGDRPRWAYLREILILPFVVKSGGYDIVHAHYGLTLVSTLLVHRPVVITFHGSDLLVSPTKYISRILAPTASKVIVVAQQLRESLGYGELIPCGISLKKFIFPSHYEDITIPRVPGELKVLFPSDPKRKIKDYGLFGAVCQKLKDKGCKIEEVHLVNIDRDNVQKIYWECDIMLLTSLSEGSPTVIKEAIAAKLPFVSVDVGDVNEWASLVDFGVVVADRDPVNIANEVMGLLGQMKTRNSLDNSECLDKLDLRRISQRVKQVYDEVLKG